MKDIPYQQYKFKDFTIEGFSRAAVQTFWRIPEFHLGFDLGAQPWMFMGTPNWFISHTHLDHLAMLPSFVARRRMMKMDPPRIFLPRANVDNVARLLKAWMYLDRGQFPCELIGMEPGEEVTLSREWSVLALPTQHRVPSLGYVVFHRRNKLLPELLSLDGNAIRQRKEAGLPITYEIRTPKVAYLGDSNPDGLDQNPLFYQAEVLIMEMTFVESRHRGDKIHKYGHIHLDDVVAREHLFQNELIIASHFTARSVAGQIHRCVEKAFPTLMDGRLKLWL
ncbi:MAG: MBL fold metallo-hydrolase [Planctomycetia bacterium]|nr:MBL fold metallo-hydrolase [Planctomycetia bacterium]MDO5113348.1 MBL fold metallo-hydrolase [Planctomycetia bacterium]